MSATVPTPEERATWERLSKSKTPVTFDMLAAVSKGIQDVVVEAMKSRDDRIAALETKLKNYKWMMGWVEDLARRPNLKYVGTWKKDNPHGYREGEFVTHGGSIWYCLRYSKEEPGTSDWQLAVHSGAVGEIELESRIKSLEERPSLDYRGVFHEGETYQHGQTVTFGGSMWVCRGTTKEKPASGEMWQLAVKRGRDAR